MSSYKRNTKSIIIWYKWNRCY